MNACGDSRLRGLRSRKPIGFRQWVVHIRNDNDDLILSDNFFDLNGGEKRVKILKGKADGLQVRSVYDIR